MMDINKLIKVNRKFKPKNLDKKIGQMIYEEPGDSGINEGDFICKLWFTEIKNGKYIMHLIKEWDIRKK